MNDDLIHPKLSTVTSKMQVTIPVRMRRKLNLKPGQKVGLAIRNGRIMVKPLRSVVEERARSLKEAKRT